MSPDHQLKASIMEELEWSPEVTADDIGVGVHDGTVTLSGQVSAYPEKVAAVAAALRVRGVTGVADEIEVQHDQHDQGHLADSEIAGAAARILTSNVILPQGRVTATVRHHRVTLEGTVPWQYQRDNAVRLIAGLHGVTEVVNRIQLAPDVNLSEPEAEQRIRAALIRNAQTDAETIHVRALGSEVERTGTVQSWAEYGQADDAAWATPGVTAVRNRLRVTG
jgi:osmotically-inducible protein OsmY